MQNSSGSVASGIRTVRETSNERMRVETITAAALVAMPIDEPRFLVPGLLPEGLTLLAGRPKIGKSWLCLTLAATVARGGVVLASFPVASGDVLYLALEDPPRRLKARLQHLGEQPPGLHLATRWPRADQGGLAELDSWLHEHPGTRLVIVDTLARFRQPHRGNADLYAADYATMVGLKTVADTHGIGILVAHHTRKAEAVDALDAISGTTGLAGGCDTAMILTRGRGEADAILTVAGRDIAEQELALRFEDGIWEHLGEAGEVTMSRSRREIMDVLRNSEGPLTPRQIADLIGKKGVTVRSTLGRMAADGDVIAREGAYTLPIQRREVRHES